MEYQEQFEAIRPYHDDEIGAPVERLIAHPQFESIINYLFGPAKKKALEKDLRSLESIEQFQSEFSFPALRNILERTADGLSSQGLENVDPKRASLFLANHRDIALDASIMQVILHEHGHQATQVTFGDNLMSSKLLIDLARLNRVFPFFRGGSRMTQYRNAQVSSAYINQMIGSEGESIWIAQQNGRAKDGNDQTHKGLIKMLAMGSKDLCATLSALNIIPVTISYEYEPCDILKVRELYLSRRGSYIKAPLEDLNSIMAGIKGKKGRIHMSFGSSLSGFLDQLGRKKLPTHETVDLIVKEADRQIHGDYRLWPFNYLAADLLTREDSKSGHYSAEDKKTFLERMEAQLTHLEGMDAMEGMDREECRKIYLELYANPVFNKARL